MAGRNLNLNLNLQVKNIAALRAALNPAFVQRSVALTNARREAQINLNEALRKEEKIQGQVAERGTTDEDRRLSALRKINAATETYKQQLADIAAQTPETRRLTALRSINSELEQQRQHLADIRESLNPKVMRQRVGSQLKIEEGERGRNFAENKERTRQLGLGKGLADLLNFPDLSKRLAGFGGKLSGVGDALSLGGKAGGLRGMLGKMAGGFGSFLGSAAAGPVGVAIGAALALTPVVKSLAAAPFKVVTAGMATVNNALKELAGGLGPVGAIIGNVEGIGSSMKSLGDKLGPAGIGLSVMGGAIEGVSQQVKEFLGISVQLVQKAQPGVVRRFQLALDDTAAVIGHRLAPLVELLTDITRGIGDVLQTVLPRTQEFREALAPLRDAFNEIKFTIAENKVEIREGLVLGLKLLGGVLKTVAGAVKVATTVFKMFRLQAIALSQPWRLPDEIRRLREGKTSELESSTGAAARHGTIMDMSSAAKRTYEEIYLNSQKEEGRENPAEQTAKNTASMIGVLEEIRDAIRTNAGGFAENVAREFVGDRTVDAAMNAARGFRQGILGH